MRSFQLKCRFLFRRSQKALCLALVFMASIGQAQAGNVYDLVNMPSRENGWTLSGTVTTDGFIGVIDVNNVSHITSFDAFVTNGVSSFSLTNSNLGSDHHVVLLSSDAKVDAEYSGLSIELGQIEFGPYGVGSNNFAWDTNGTNTDLFGGVYNGSQAWFSFVPYTGSIEFATASSAAVPEPSTFALLGFGGVGLAIAAYRRRQMKLTIASSIPPSLSR